MGLETEPLWEAFFCCWLFYFIFHFCTTWWEVAHPVAQIWEGLLAMSCHHSIHNGLGLMLCAQLVQALKLAKRLILYQMSWMLLWKLACCRGLTWRMPLVQYRSLNSVLGSPKMSCKVRFFYVWMDQESTFVFAGSSTNGRHFIFCRTKPFSTTSRPCRSNA